MGALEGMMKGTLRLPYPQLSEIHLMNLFPDLPCLHSFALKQALTKQPHRRLSMRMKHEDKFLVSMHILKYTVLHDLHLLHSVCTHVLVHMCLCTCACTHVSCVYILTHVHACMQQQYPHTCVHAYSMCVCVCMTAHLCNHTCTLSQIPRRVLVNQECVLAKQKGV